MKDTISKMRFKAEFCGQKYVAGEFRAAYIAQTESGANKFYEAEITVKLRPGWSGKDHLFDRTLAAFSDLLADNGHIFSSVAALRKAATLSWENGRPEVYIDAGRFRIDEAKYTPAMIKMIDEADASDCRAMEKRWANQKRKLIKNLKVMQRGDVWILTDRANPEYGFHLKNDEICFPPSEFVSRDAAEAALTQLRIRIGAR